MMKIILKNGTVIELMDGETIPAPVMSMIMGEQATARVKAAPVPTMPLAAPAPPTPMIEGEPDEDDGDGDEAEAAAGMLPMAIPAPKPPRRRRPGTVHLTERECRVLAVVREHPNGITSAAVAGILSMPVSQVSLAMWNLRAMRPSKDTETPLLSKISFGRHRATELGMSVRVVVSKQPARDNRKTGWA